MVGGVGFLGARAIVCRVPLTILSIAVERNVATAACVGRRRGGRWAMRRCPADESDATVCRSENCPGPTIVLPGNKEEIGLLSDVY